MPVARKVSGEFFVQYLLGVLALRASLGADGEGLDDDFPVIKWNKNAGFHSVCCQPKTGVVLHHIIDVSMTDG
jgi:hypothetical protein